MWAQIFKLILKGTTLRREASIIWLIMNSRVLHKKVLKTGLKDNSEGLRLINNFLSIITLLSFWMASLLQPELLLPSF